MSAHRLAALAGPKPGMERMIAARRASSGSEAMLRLAGPGWCRRSGSDQDQRVGVEQLDQRVAQLGGGAGVQLGV